MLVEQGEIGHGGGPVIVGCARPDRPGPSDMGRATPSCLGRAPSVVGKAACWLHRRRDMDQASAARPLALARWLLVVAAARLRHGRRRRHYPADRKRPSASPNGSRCRARSRRSTRPTGNTPSTCTGQPPNIARSTARREWTSPPSSGSISGNGCIACSDGWSGSRSRCPCCGSRPSARSRAAMAGGWWRCSCLAQARARSAGTWSSRAW